MKHAGPDALDQLEPILDEIRKLDGLKEKKRGAFSAARAAFCISMKTRRDFLPI